MSETTVRVFLEHSEKRTFACAVDWPGWCRSGRDEPSALQTLFAYATRYSDALAGSGIAFNIPPDNTSFKVIERLEGNATTAYGAPAMLITVDDDPLAQEELDRQLAILQACWRTFDRALQQADGLVLRKGPRGGGRDLEEIARHVVYAEGEYLKRIGITPAFHGDPGSAAEREDLRSQILAALALAMHGELPAHGPRGGTYWPLRFFLRRTAWHVLDHAWEIEDRLPGG